MTKRVWHKGPPPFPGWWETSFLKMTGKWRWWNGLYWSAPARPWMSKEEVASAASLESLGTDLLEWTSHWPRRARVPRVDPRSHLKDHASQSTMTRVNTRS